MADAAPASVPEPPRGRSDRPFLICLVIIGGFYVLLIVGMLIADLKFMTDEADPNQGGFLARLLKRLQYLPQPIMAALEDRDIRYSLKLSLISCSITAILAVW